MNLADINPAIALINANPLVADLRERTYLATYPGMISIGAAQEVANEVKFHQLSTLVYGWMPRIVRIDPLYLPDAVQALQVAITATDTNFRAVPVNAIAVCLHSVVGASKLLHFANPDVFPIWDSNIEVFRANPNSDVTSVPQYLDYVDEVHNIRQEVAFPALYDAFCATYNTRLIENGITPYPISHVRAIESAAFELVP